MYDLIYELNHICPRILLTVLPQLEFKLKSTEESERLGSVSLLARMFSEKGSTLAQVLNRRQRGKYEKEQEVKGVSGEKERVTKPLAQGVQPDLRAEPHLSEDPPHSPLAAESKLKSTEESRRHGSVLLLARMFSGNGVHVGTGI